MTTKAQAAALVGKAQTVLGPIDPDQLGIAMMHEHLLVDMTHLAQEPKEATRRALFRAPVSIELLSSLRFSGQHNRDNMCLVDIETAISEAMPYKRAGGGTIVEMTNIGLHRDPTGLSQISRATGLHVIMGCSYYVDASHPSDMDEKTEEQIVDEIVRDIRVGAEGTNVRSGIIGEVGCQWPLTPNERKVLRASAKAQQLTGASLSVHPGRHETAPLEILQVLAQAGADLSRTIMCHLDRTTFRNENLKKIADSGCFMEYDLFGHEDSYYRLAPHVDMPNDAQRLNRLAWLIGEGYGHQLLVSHDVDAKYKLTRYGGCGYAHIVSNIVPRMRLKGFQETDIHAILVDNPRRALTFVEPANAG